MKRTTSISCLLILTFAISVFAQQSPPKMVEVPENMLSETQKSQLEMRQIQEKAQMYGNWVGLGKEVGAAVDGSLSALTNRAEEFSKTGVGKFTMFIVLWKVMGQDAIQALIGIPLLVVVFTVWVWSYRNNCITRSVLIKQNPDKTKEYKVINEEVRAEEKWGHVFVLVLFFAVCILTIFI